MAIDDLSTGSDALNSLLTTEVPSHALVGTGGSQFLEDGTGLLSSLPGQAGAVFKVANFFISVANFIPAAQHDGAVSRPSQEGGIDSAAATVFNSYDSIHIFVTNSVTYSNRLFDLLNTPTNSDRFGNFPGITSSFNTLSDVPREFAAVTAQDVQPGVVIQSPANGSLVTPGDTVSVVVMPINGADVASVLVVGTGTAEEDTTAPFEIPLVIPSDAVGIFEVLAVGKNADSTVYYTSQPITLTVTPTATLNSIDIIPDEINQFAVGETRQVSVVGTYTDSVLRDLTEPDSGTTYLSSDTSVATISDTGLVTATGVGATTIIAQNSNLQDSITVKVIFANQAPVAMASAPTAVNLGESITLVGNQSFDPDSGPSPLNYEWRQVAGPIQFTESIFSPVMTFTPANPGRYTFSLVVRDGQADSPPANVSFVVIGRGDCNIDGKVDAGDASAIVLEVFDGDGDQAGDATGGTFAGTPFGCDANNDTFIQAGDLTCTTLLVFDPTATCAATP